MPSKKNISPKAPTKAKKEKKVDKKLVAKKSKEILEWKSKNINQKWFFSLEEKEQNLLEMSYIVVLQICPELSWEDYLNRLRIADNCSRTSKAVKKSTMKFLHLD